MELNPNKYRLVFPTIARLWEKSKDNTDFEYVISEIAVSTHIEAASVCMIVQHLFKDDRLEPIKKKLIEFYRYDKVVEIEKNKELFEDLANSIICPSCNKKVKGDKFNLGEDFNSFEGCKECYDKIKRA